jgi:hypothetical protein
VPLVRSPRCAEQHRRSLRERLAGANGTARWRIAHVLGAFPTLENAETLFSLIDHDKDIPRARPICPMRGTVKLTARPMQLTTRQSQSFVDEDGKTSSYGVGRDRSLSRFRHLHLAISDARSWDVNARGKSEASLALGRETARAPGYSCRMNSPRRRRPLRRLTGTSFGPRSTAWLSFAGHRRSCFLACECEFPSDPPPWPQPAAPERARHCRRACVDDPERASSANKISISMWTELLVRALSHLPSKGSFGEKSGSVT